MDAVRREARVRERFWKRVTKTAKCWLWTGGTDKDGYGRVWYNNSKRYAHRVSFEWVYGPALNQVLHRCDVPACVRPDHLFDGTQADNLADARDKGRKDDRGEKNSQSKLTETRVREIRRRFAGGTPLTVLANETGLNYTHLSEVVNRKVWAHVV